MLAIRRMFADDPARGVQTEQAPRHACCAALAAFGGAYANQWDLLEPGR
jgi:hypothetical protein